MPIFDDDNSMPDPNAVVASQLANDAGASAPVDPQSVASALLRQHLDPNWPPKPDTGMAKPGSFDPSQYLGSPVGNMSGDEAAQYLGKPVDDSAKKKTESEESIGVGGNLKAAGKGIAQEAIKAPAAIAQGAAVGINAITPTMVATAGGEGTPLSVDDLPGGANNPPAEPVEQNPVLGKVYKGAGAVKDFAEKAIPMTDAEKSSLGGQVGSGLGGMIAPLAATALGGPVAGAATMGLQSVGQTYDAARQKGASAEDAATAAGLDGAVATVLGTLPLGIVLKPFEALMPAAGAGAKDIVARALAHAAQSGVTFTAVGEAQQYIADQIAQQYYDPSANYTPDVKRMLGEFLTGGLIGFGSGAFHEAMSVRSRGAAVSDSIDHAQKYDGASSDATNPEGTVPYTEDFRDIGSAGAGSGTGPGPQPNTGSGGAGAQSGQQQGQGPGQGQQQQGAGGTGGARAGASSSSPADRAQEWHSAWGQTEGAAEPGNKRWSTLAGVMQNAYGFRSTDLKNASFADLRNFMANADALTAAGFDKAAIAKMTPGDMAAAVLDLQMKAKGQQPGAQPGAQPEEEGAGEPGTRSSPIDLNTTADLRRAESVMNTEHTNAQGEAGNVQRGHVTWNGLGAKIEVPAGGTRRGVNKETGENWESTHPHAYGEFKDLPDAADGMKPDVIFGDHPGAPTVYVVDEIDPQTGKYRQSKSFVGFQTPADVAQSYSGISSKSMAGIGGMRAFGRDEFVTMAKAGGLSKPVTDLKAKAAEQPNPKTGAEQQPGGMAADTPSAEPHSDIAAQARDLADKKSRRGAVWLPKSSVDHLSKLGKLDEIIGSHPAQHNFDGAGGILIARDLSTISQANKDKKAGRSVQEIVGRLVGAGAGKPADATHVVQQVDEQGNVTRERAVRAGDVNATYRNFSRPDRSVRVLTTEEAIKRRADIVSREAGDEQQAPEPREPSHHDHHAVADALQQAGIDPAQVRPADIARAGEIHAEEGLSAYDSFPVAVLRSLVEDGHISPEAVKQVLGNETAKKLLESGIRHGGRGLPRAENAGAATRGEIAEAATGLAAGSNEQNAEAAASKSDEHVQAGEADGTPGAEADGRGRGVSAAGDKEAGRDELSAAGGKQHAEPAGAGGAAGERAGSEQGTANRKNGAAAKDLKRKPWSLLEFIGHRGGLRPSPEWEHMGLDFRSKVTVPGKGFRYLIRRDGMSMDSLIENLREGGYIEEAPADRPDDVGVLNHVYELIGKELRGDKQYGLGVEAPTGAAEQERVDESWARADDARDRLHAALDEAGIPLHSIEPKLESRAIHLMLETEDAGEDHDPLDLLERAAGLLEAEDGEIRKDDTGVGEEALDAFDEERAPAPSRAAHGEISGQAAGEEEADASQGGAASPSGESAGQEPKPAATERTEAGEQGVIPGAERIGDGEHAQRKADEGLKPKKAQKPADEGLFGDDSKQTDLVDIANKPPDRAEDVKSEAEQAPETGPSDSWRDNFEIEPALRVKSEGEARLQGGQYSAIVRRLKPWAVEKGYGDTPFLAQNDGLRRLKENNRLREPVEVADTSSVLAAWWKDDLNVFGRGQVTNAARVPEKWSKAAWQHIPDDVKQKLAAVRGTDADPKRNADAPTWAEVLHAAPRHPTHTDRPDVDQVIAAMKEIAPKAKTYRDLTPSQQEELFHRMKEPSAAEQETPKPTVLDPDMLAALEQEFPNEAKITVRPDGNRQGKRTALDFALGWDNAKKDGPDSTRRRGGSGPERAGYDASKRHAAETPAEKPEPKSKKEKAISPERKLRDDWGVGRIDGYAETDEFTGEQTDYGVKGGVKDAFLKDASNYLKSVASELEEKGLTAAEVRNKKPRAVSVNEAGPATSGDVYLNMVTPNGAFLHVQIGEGFGGFQQTSNGIQVMYRAGAKQYGIEGQNRWAPTGLTAGELAQMLHAEAEDADARILQKKGEEPHTPTEADHGNSLDLHGSDAAAGAEDVQPAQPERGTEQVHGHEGDGSEPSVRGTDEGRPEASERLPETALGEGSRGEGDRGDGAVSEPGDDAKGRSERPGERASDRVVGENYRIEPGALEEDRGWMQKARDNVAALELAHKIEAEERPATAAEQRILAKYVGWGGLKSAFPDSKGSFGKGLEKVGARVRELLSDDEYKTAQRSMQYAHYTAEHVVRSIWKGIERLAGEHQINDVFEPGMGVGNFAGMMPADFHAAYHGIEMDGPTARIAKLLYPKFGVRQADYTRIAVPENSVDLVIGNPPFADVVIKTDPKYAKQGFFLHDYFFAKSLDAVRPGGVLAFISSAGTMNKLDPKGREYLADRADLVGAVRLNSKAFKENAGTEVTTDIIFLRKRLPGEQPGDRSWTETVEVTLPGKEGKPVTGTNNRYFAEHPEMVLGEEGFFDKLYEDRYAVRPRDGQDLEKDLAAAMERLPTGVMKPDAAQEGPSSIDFASTEKKDGTFYFGPKGELYQMRGGAGVPVARRGAGVEGGLTTAAVERIKGLIPVRDALREVIAANLADDAKAGDAARAQLNKHYDAFVDRFGPINKAEFQSRRPTVIQQENARAEAREEARYAGLPFDEGSFDPSRLLDRKATLSEMAKARKEAKEKALAAGKPWSEGDFDPDEMPDVVIEKRPNIEPFMDDQESYRLRAIEHYDDASHKAKKGAIFSENIITRERKPDIKSAADALLYSLSQFGRVNMPEIARLSGKSVDEALEELGETIYREPGTHESFVTKDEYLSGDVRKKLVQAKAAAEQDPSLRRNVEALEAAQPTPLAPSQIRATLGMPWIPPQTVEEFGRELGLDSLKVRYVPGLAQWFASGDTDSAAAMSTWGTDKRRAPALINDLLNRLPIKIYDEVRDAEGNKTRVLNVEATEAAQQKAQAIREKFESWIWSDPDRTEKLAGKYNNEKNNLVSREYDGSYLTTPGVASHWGWRPHQKRVVARIIQSGNTYMAHAVGAGKTSAMIGAGMEMRRLGLVKKPMYAVPNHMLAQFTKEFYEQYPTAKIAVADERRFHTDRRKQFIANVANEDLDAVIITHSAFGMIPVSNDFADQVVQDELQKYRDMLADIPKDHENRITRSRIEKQIERLEQRLSGRGTARKDQVFTYEEMGVDFLFVDEAHLFRKLDFATQMGSVKGINPEGSNMAWDLYVKSLYLDSVRPGRNLVLASGTPVTNTMAELYSLSRYLQRDLLAERGMEHFDAWAASHGEPVTELEQDAAGGYKPVTRFARFVNVPELSNMVRQVMDVVTSKQLEQYVTRPKLKGGKRIMRLAEKSPALADYQHGLAERMEAIRRRKGPPKKGDDIMLSVINDGRHAAIDMRLVGAKSDPNSKLNLLVNDVHEIWKNTKNQPFHKVKDGKYEDKPFMHGPATQLIFANLGLSGTRGFAVPDYIRSELVRRGVPKNEVQFIYDYKTSVQKQKLFNDMNAGNARVLIGSTAKMSTGINVQPRLYAIHNLDPLWYPADDEQRNGRGIRQGNMNPEIEIRDYSTKGTYDSVMWGLMEKKARFIQGFFEGDPSLRDMDDLGEASQYEQAKAITTNDPRLIRLTELKQELEKANRRWAAFDQELHALKTRRAGARSEIAYLGKRIESTKKDIADRVDTRGDKFNAALGPKKFDKRVDFTEALQAKLKDLRVKENKNKTFKLGSVGGFPIKAQILEYPGVENDFYNLVYLDLNGGIERRVKGDGETGGLVRSMEHVLHGLESDLVDYQRAKAKQEKFLADSEENAKAVFTGQDNIDTLTHQVRELEAEISRTDLAEPHPPEVDPATINSLDSLSIAANYGSMNELQPYSPRLGMFAASAAPQRAPNSYQESRGLTPEAEARRRQFAERQRLLRATLDHMTGGRFSSGEFQLFMHNVLTTPRPGAAGYGDINTVDTIGGAYEPMQRAVRLALADPAYPDTFASAVHEGGHVALDHFATDQERAVLRSPAEQRRMAEYIAPRMGISVDQAASMSPYEIEANAWQWYATERARGEKAGAGLHVAIRRLFERVLDFFRRLGQWLRGRGFQHYGDIFDKMYSGEMGKRDSRIADPNTDSDLLREIREENAKAAAHAVPAEVPQTETTQFKKWFGDSKVVDESGAPLVVYHGGAKDIGVFGRTADKAEIGREVDDIIKKAGRQNVHPDTEYLMREPVHFFTDDEGIADGYQTFNQQVGNSETTPVYLRMEKPLDLRENGFEKLNDLLDDPGAFKEPQGDEITPRDSQRALARYVLNDQASIFKAARAKGYDGAIFPDTDVRGRYLHTSYVAFDPHQIKHAENNSGHFSITNPDVAARRRARPGSGAPRPSRESRIRDAIDRMLETRLGRKTVENFIDLNEPVQHLQNELIDRKDGAALPDTQDFHARKQLYPGRVATETQSFNKAYLDPMVEFMRKREIELREAADYVEAKHVQERNAYIGKMYPAGHQFNKAMSDKKVIGGSGRSQEWADNVIADAARTNKTRDLDRVHDYIQAIRHYVLNKLVTGHLLTPEEAQQWRDRYEHYVDLRGFEDNPDDKPSDYREPAQFNVRGKEAQMAMGRTTVANNPIVNMLDQAYRAIERVEKNRYLHAVWNAFGKANAENPGSVSDIVKFDHSKPKKVIDKNTGLVRQVYDRSFVMSPNAVAVKINGITHHMLFEDRDIAEAVKRMRPDEVGPFFRGVLRLENKLKAMWTHWSPDFLARHFLARYPIEGAMNSFEQKESGEHNVTKYLRQSYPFVGAAYKAIRAEEAAAKPTGDKDVEALRKYYAEMKEHGGSMAFRQMRDVDLIREHLQRELKALQGSTLSNVVYRHEQFVKAMDGVTNAMDNALRLSAYASARKQGKTPQQAAVIARQATIDFMQKGKLAAKLGIYFPFGNVAINTGSRMARAAYRSKMIRRAIFGMAMAGFTLAMWNYLIGGSDEHGNPYFEMVPPYDREKNFIWLNPLEHDEKGHPQVYKIPNQFNYSLPMNIGYAVATRMFGKEGWGETLASVVKTAVTAFTPLGEEGNLAALAAPEVLRPAVHIWSNKNSFGNPIHNDEAFNRGPNAYSGRKDKDGQVRTGEGWKWFAQALNNLSGGDRRHSGFVDPYPESVREAFNYAGQAQGSLLQHMYETFYNTPAKGGIPIISTDPTKVPIERVFRGNDYDAHDRYERGHRQFLNKHPWLK